MVGITEDLAHFVAVLEATLPRFFRGATQLYNSGEKTLLKCTKCAVCTESDFNYFIGAKSHLRQTQNKTQPLASTLRKMRESPVYRMELEFYLFAKTQFNFVKQRVFNAKDGYLQVRKQQFMFEKIRPSENTLDLRRTQLQRL